MAPGPQSQGWESAEKGALEVGWLQRQRLESSGPSPRAGEFESSPGVAPETLGPRLGLGPKPSARRGGEGRRLCEPREDFLFWRPEAAGGLYAQARAALGAFGNLGCWESGPGGKGRNPQRGHLPPRCPRTGLGRARCGA